MAKKIERAGMTQTDSKGKVTRAPRDNSSGEAQNFRWWKVDEGSMANAIAQTIKFMMNRQQSRLEQLTVSTRLYGNTNAFNLLGSAMARASSVNSNPMSQRISFNLCSSVIDTLVSKIAKNKVVPTYITNGGIWKVQKQAKQLTKFTQGLFYQENVHKKVVDAFRDSGVWGDGIVHVFEKDDKLCIERALPHEFIVDSVESLSSPPQQLHRVKVMDRDIALELFPELEEAIKLVNPANYQEVGGHGSAADLIIATESWHLRSGPDAGDGKHVISIGDGAIVDSYKKDYFPFPILPYCKKLLGYWSQGAVERLQNIQGEINRDMALIQKTLWMGGSFKVLLENGSKVVSQHMNNDIGAIIHYTGTPPQYVTPPLVQPEVYQWIDSLIIKGYKQEGVSTLSASGEHPLGVDSGKALRTMVDVEDDRFLSVQQAVEDFTLEIARQSIEVVKDIYSHKKSYEVIFPNTQFIETIDWKDIDLEDDQYVLKAFPTSSLSDDLTGRLSEIQELAQAGMISPRTARRLMGMPDVEMNENLSNAAEDLLHRIFEDMLDDGIYRSFEAPYMDMQLAQQLALEYYNYADYMNCPDDRLQLINQFINEINDTKMKLQAAMAPQMAAGQPQSQPMPSPQSNLIPNVPTGGMTQ